MTDPSNIEQQLKRIEEQQQEQVGVVEELHDLLEVQTDEIRDQLEIQNAILLEVAHALHERNRIEMGQEGGEHRRRGAAKSIEDNALDLREQVDLDAVRRAER